MRLLAALIWFWAGAAAADCRQALALGMDVSGSVDSAEYRLQLDGLAAAVMRPEVQAAFLALPDAPVRLLVYEWAGQEDQRVLVAWTEVLAEETLAQIAVQLRGTQRVKQAPTTALGQAMRFGATHLLHPDHSACWRLTLDVSGDGKSNTGPRPREVRAGLSVAGVTVNGLVIGSDDAHAADQTKIQIGELVAYYQSEVLVGDDAFVEVALGFTDFEEAMARKLLKELQVLAVSAVHP